MAQDLPQYTTLRQPRQRASEAAEQPGARQGEPMGAVGRGAGGEDILREKLIPAPTCLTPWSGP